MKGGEWATDSIARATYLNKTDLFWSYIWLVKITRVAFVALNIGTATGKHLYMLLIVLTLTTLVWQVELKENKTSYKETIKGIERALPDNQRTRFVPQSRPLTTSQLQQTSSLEAVPRFPWTQTSLVIFSLITATWICLHKLDNLALESRHVYVYSTLYNKLL